jgi:glycine cleavage system H protein
MDFPPDLRYHPEHLWVRPEGDAVVLGITDFAQDQLGEIVYLKLPEPGENVTESESIGEVESTKVVSDLIAPVSGTVVAVNESALLHPEILNDSPYAEGWLVKVELARPLENSSSLMDADAYRRMLGQ